MKVPVEQFGETRSGEALKSDCVPANRLVFHSFSTVVVTRLVFSTWICDCAESLGELRHMYPSLVPGCR